MSLRGRNWGVSLYATELNPRVKNTVKNTYGGYRFVGSKVIGEVEGGGERSHEFEVDETDGVCRLLHHHVVQVAVAVRIHDRRLLNSSQSIPL